MADNNIELMDIVVQGAYDDFTSTIVESYLKLPFVNNIVISCWRGNVVAKSIFDNSQVSVVFNKYPFQNGTDNRNLQIVSSLGGVKKITTKHSAKMRSDQLYSYDSMIQMYEFYMANKKTHQLFVAGMYPALLFHPRDHIFWGETQDLLKMFDAPLEYNGLTDRVRIDKQNLAKFYPFFSRAETYIGAHYCSNFDERIKYILIQPEKYLYDGAPLWHDAYNISQEVTSKFFKSFPRTGIDLIWPKKGWINYPYEMQHRDYLECWAEEGY
jgi:hypothetical protein